MKHLLIVFLFTVQLLWSQNSLRIASAGENGGYDRLAQSIKQIVEAYTPYKINVIHTDGSVDNIKRLKKQKVDLAIVQNDTALYAKNGYYPFENPIENIQMLMSFYSEPIYIVTNQKGINSIEQLRTMYINVGQKKSGLRASAEVLLRSAGIWDYITPFYQNIPKSIRYLEAGRIQAIFLNSFNTKVQQHIDAGDWKVVPIPARLIKKLQNTFSYFSSYKVDENLYTIAVKSILVARDDMDPKIAKEIIKVLYEHYEALQFPHTKPNKKECFCANPFPTWHSGTMRFFEAKHMEPPQTYRDEGYILYGMAAFIGLLALIISIVFVFFHRSNAHKEINPNDHYVFNLLKILYLKIVDHKYIIFFIVVFVFYMISILFIRHYEHIWALENNQYTPFDDFSLWDSIVWLFVFATSSYNDGIFPHSDGGKFFASLIPMIGWGGLLAFATLVASDKIKKFLLEVKGMGSVAYEDHIVLCGWNKNGCNIISSLTHENIENKRKIVILAEEKYKSEIDLCVLNQKSVTHIVGYAKSKEDLERANLKKANTVVVLQSDDHTDPDAYAILDVMTINKYANDLGIREQRGSEFQVIIQLHDSKNKSIATDAGADQIISIASVESSILANMIQTPGVNNFVEEIFDFNDVNDIYSIDITSGSKLIGKTYNEALLMLREFNILLLSINIAYHRSQEEAEKIKKEHGLTRDVITNPINKAENEYKIQEGGMLIVLAQYEQTVLDAIEKMKGEEK